MNLQELEQMLKDLESDLVERKEYLRNKKDEIRQAITAYANDLPDHRRPGVIFIGAKDDGSCANIFIDDNLLRDAANLRDDGKIQPIPSMTVEKMTLRGCNLVVIVVQPSMAPPVRIDGITWIRVGPRRAKATFEEEKRLAERRLSRDLPFDIQPLPSAIIDDLDFDLFKRDYLPWAIAPEVLEQNARSVKDQLKALRFLTPDGLPTVLGILVLGKDIRRYIPGDYVQFLRFEGKELTSPIRDQKEIDGTLLELLRRIDEVLEANNSVATNFASGSTEIRRSEYPMSALQQLVRNAILHRTYDGTNAPVRIYWFSDRIEIHSPGGPFGQVTRDNFGQPGVTDYRNPHLAEAMKILGYVQRFGLGIQIARQELAKNGNPPLEFVVEPNHVLVIVKR